MPQHIDGGINTPNDGVGKEENVEKDEWLFWDKLISSEYTILKERFDQEAFRYIDAYKHDFKTILPERFLRADRVDINVVYPVVKTLIPKLYFRDPKVFVKSEQETVIVPIEDEEGNSIPNPDTGEPLVEEFDGPSVGISFQSALNDNIKRAKLKKHTKDAILDAHLTYYGVIKCGWDNEQGTATMGEGAPPSVREDTDKDIAYGIRLKPWNVLIDPESFSNPKWIAVRYVVTPIALQKDKRLKNTEKIKGNSTLDESSNRKRLNRLSEIEKKRVEYWEIYIKPSAEYPDGKYYIYTQEVKEKFLFIDKWPYKVKKFPIKILSFNDDPYDELPIPDVRYYIGQQKVKLNLRAAAYEFVKRSMPVVVVNNSGLKNAPQVEQAILAGQIPRVVMTSRPVDQVLKGVSFPTLNPEFHRLDALADQDITRVVQQVAGTGPGSEGQFEFSSQVKALGRTEQINTSERADRVFDFVQEIVEFWSELFKEFAGPENYTTVDGQKFPVKWSREQIDNGKWKVELKPFSMSFEDPVIVRSQWTDILNLVSSPGVRAAMQQQGFDVNLKHVWNRIVETFNERDFENFLIDEGQKPEDQILRALQENQELIQQQPHNIEATDNDKIHILIHQLIGEQGNEAVLAHGQALQEKLALKPGGGNKEGLPTKGVASNQELLRKPANASPINKRTAISREA